MKSSEIVTFNISGGIFFKLSVASNVVANVASERIGRGGAPYERVTFVSVLTLPRPGWPTILESTSWVCGINPSTLQIRQLWSGFYKSVNFGAETSAGSPSGWAQVVEAEVGLATPAKRCDALGPALPLEARTGTIISPISSLMSRGGQAGQGYP